MSTSTVAAILLIALPVAFNRGRHAIGLALGIGVSLATEIPLAPEGGLALGALLGWLWRRDQHRRSRPRGLKMRRCLGSPRSKCRPSTSSSAFCSC